jgi:MFS family permease
LFIGQLARGTGMWMQMVTVPWLVLILGGSAFDLGLVTSMQFIPALVLAPFGGVLADRLPKRKVLMATQLVGGLQATALLLLVLTDLVAIWHLLVLAVVYGLVTAVELPVRQAFSAELVPREDLRNAISLHSAAWNTTRLVGPGIAGLLIATAGIAASVAVSAVASTIVIATVSMMSRRDKHREPVDASEARGILGSLADAFRYALRTPSVLWSLVLIGAGSAMGIMIFQTLAPLFAVNILGLGSAGYGSLMGIWGAGAVVAAFTIAFRGGRDTRRAMVVGALVLAVLLVVLAMAEVPEIAFGITALLGFFQIMMVQNVNLTVQQVVPHELRGRVMGLYVTVFHGANPLGALTAGTMAELLGIQGTFVLGGVALAAVALTVAWRLRGEPQIADTSRPPRPEAAGT